MFNNMGLCLFYTFLEKIISFHRLLRQLIVPCSLMEKPELQSDDP